MISLSRLARRAAALAITFVTAASIGGSFTSVVKSGAPAATAPIEYDEKWHSGLIVGIVELSGPYDLSRICPNGWAEIKTETSFVNGLLQVVTFNIYNPQTITVRCAAGAVPPSVSMMAPPLGAASPPPPPLPPPPPR